MKERPDTEKVRNMRLAIIEKYGPSIHNELIEDMSANRIARIYSSMKKLEDRIDIPKGCIKGQMSLFD